MAYVVPDAAALKARYPAFADVADDTVTYWITDAQRSVDESWTETDYAVALMALAAHNMALAGYGTEVLPVSEIPAGVTRIKSGQFEANFTEQQANARASGSLESTRYGQEYRQLLYRNRGGPMVSNTGTLPPPYGHFVDGGA
jgi:hypothetical protein